MNKMAQNICTFCIKRVNVTPKQYFYDESNDKHAILCETNPLHFCLEFERFHLIISHQGAVELKYLIL